MPQDEVTSNSEEIKHIALSIVEICLAGGISQSVNQSVSQSDSKQFSYIKT